MRMTRNMQFRIEQLEQWVAQKTINHFFCYVDAGADRDQVVEKFRIDNDVKDDDEVRIVQYVSSEFPPTK